MDEGSATATAHFTNAGKSVVTIFDVRPSCGCTTTNLKKNSYKPGESGQLQISLSLTGLSGTQQKTIQVFSDDAPDKPTELTVQTKLPEFVTLASGPLIWTVGENDKPKEALLVPGSTFPKLQVTGIRSDGTFFIASLRHDGGSGQQTLVVRPRTTVVPSQEVVFVDAQVPGGVVHTTAVVVRVR